MRAPRKIIQREVSDALNADRERGRGRVRVGRVLGDEPDELAAEEVVEVAALAGELADGVLGLVVFVFTVTDLRGACKWVFKCRTAKAYL